MVSVFFLGLAASLFVVVAIGAACHKHGKDGACNRWKNIYIAEQEWWRNYLSKERHRLDTMHDRDISALREHHEQELCDLRHRCSTYLQERITLEVKHSTDPKRLFDLYGEIESVPLVAPTKDA